MPDDIAIIIPAAGIGRGMKSYGSKSLIELGDGRSIIRRQIDVIRTVHRAADIIVVVGFEAEKVVRALPAGIRAVENESYEHSGVARSILMGLRASNARRVLIVYGDLVFNRECLLGFPKNKSAIVTDTVGLIRPDDVGVNLDSGMAVHFDYGLDTKWGQIAQLTGRELHLYKSIASHQDARRLLGWEIFNRVVDRGGEFQAHEPRDMKLVEVDSPRDIPRTKSI